MSCRAFSTFSLPWFFRFDVWLRRESSVTLSALINRSAYRFVIDDSSFPVYGLGGCSPGFFLSYLQNDEAFTSNPLWSLHWTIVLSKKKKDGSPNNFFNKWLNNSHFLMLLNLLLFLLKVIHDLHPLRLHQTTFLNVEFFFCLQKNKSWLRLGHVTRLMSRPQLP